jgi:HAD superfamily hydrolase (TIGR01450 family)
MEGILKAVILAAGIGSRLSLITHKKPKCMIKVSGKPILYHQIHAYLKAGFKDIVVVAGYRINQIRNYCNKFKRVNIKVLENKDYKTTNNMYSLFLTKDEVAGNGFFLSNGDVVFDPKIISDCVNTSSIKNAILCDNNYYSKESMKVSVDKSGYINNINKEISSSKAFSTSIDLYKFSSQSSNALFEKMSEIITEEKNLNEWTEVALQILLKQGIIKMRPFDIKGKRWIEIDDLKDLSIADKLFNKIGKFKKNRLFLVDLDGTIYLGNQPINGAKKFYNKMKNLGKHVYFLSNNSSKSKLDYVKKLKSMGIETSKKEIILSTDGVIHYLKKNKIEGIFILGTESMKQEFKQAGFNIESKNPECVIIGYDTELTYVKLCKTALLLEKGANFIATHPDKVCPTTKGPIPDIGSILALLETATGRKPYKIFGKPNPEFVSHVMERHKISKGETIIIGDRLYTDMELARRIGCKFICVLSGETKREDIENIKYHPDLIVQNIGELIDLIK